MYEVGGLEWRWEEGKGRYDVMCMSERGEERKGNERRMMNMTMKCEMDFV